MRRMVLIFSFLQPTQRTSETSQQTTYQPINRIPEVTVSISEKHSCKKTLKISISMNTSKIPN